MPAGICHAGRRGFAAEAPGGRPGLWLREGVAEAGDHPLVGIASLDGFRRSLGRVQGTKDGRPAIAVRNSDSHPSRKRGRVGHPQL